MKEYAARPGTAYDERWWSAVHVLFDEAFPGLPTGIVNAAAAGSPWPEMTTPFALFEGDRCVAHVGVLSHPLRLAGKDALIAGVHAVCTAKDRRMQGLCRRLLTSALEWADETHDAAKLATDDPPVYAGHGFEVVPTFDFRATLAPTGGVRTRRLRPLDGPDDAALLQNLLARRAPVSERLSTRDSGWMVTIVASLTRRIREGLVYLPDHEAVVIVDHDPAQGANSIVDVIAPVLPPGEVVLGAADHPELPAFWTFAPDLIDPGAEPVKTPDEDGYFMVRGDWPRDLGPFGISPVWDH